MKKLQFNLVTGTNEPNPSLMMIDIILASGQPFHPRKSCFHL